MSATMRAKMKINTVTFRGDPDNPDTPRQYEASAVYDNATEENRRFNKATPWAKLEMNVDNPAAKLVPGKEYYVDFTPCDQADAQAESEKAETMVAPDHAAHELDEAADAEAVAKAALTPDADTLPEPAATSDTSGTDTTNMAAAAAPWAAPEPARIEGVNFVVDANASSAIPGTAGPGGWPAAQFAD